MDSGECSRRSLFFFLEPDEMTNYTKQCGSYHTIASGQLVTNLAEVRLPSACKSYQDSIGSNMPDSPSSFSEVLQNNISDIFRTAKKPNVTLIMTVRDVNSILKKIDAVVEADISKV